MASLNKRKKEMKTILMISLMSLFVISCGKDDKTKETVETVTTSPVQGNCYYRLLSSYYNPIRKVTVCTVGYTCGSAVVNHELPGYQWCRRVW